MDDLDSIAEYIARESGSRVAAERFTRELRAKCRDLASAPIVMGRSRPELRPDLRSYPHKRYVIFFRYWVTYWKSSTSSKVTATSMHFSAAMNLTGKRADRSSRPNVAPCPF